MSAGWSDAIVESAMYGQHIVTVTDPKTNDTRRYLHAPAKDHPPEVFVWIEKHRRWGRITAWGPNGTRVRDAVERHTKGA